MFDANSRYAQTVTYTVTDRRGRTVTVVGVPGAPDQTVLGTHRRRQGERLDHLAQRYLSNAASSWRIAEANDVMLAETLTETVDISIPGKVY